MTPLRKRSKYGNQPVIKDGLRFDSQKEYLRWLVLKDMEKHGEIAHLARQITFSMIVNGKLICKLVVDFYYHDIKRNKEIAEDAKGWQTPVSKIKMKLAAALYPTIEWKLS